jgi:hypothetical protein
VSASAFLRKAPPAALPVGRYVGHPLTVKCESIGDVRRFLTDCRWVSPIDLFGKYSWQPPEEFERLKKGMCVDFSLWTWRQLVSLGYDARFVVGRGGRYGEGHAWVEYFKDGRCFLLEPQACVVGETLPRLTTIEYKPRMSVSWDGKKLKYFVHETGSFNPGLRTVAPLVWEWLRFWGWFWLRNIPRLHRIPRNLWRHWRKSDDLARKT